MIKIRADHSESWNPFAVELQRQNKLNIAAKGQSRLERLTNIEINRLVNLPSNLRREVNDSHEQVVIKDVLGNIVQEVVRRDCEQGWHRNIVSRLHANKFSALNQTVRRYFTLRQIEEEIQPHTERLKLEINKRRYRLEIECANQLGLATPWKRTRYRRPVMEEEITKDKNMVNPLEISLHSDIDRVKSEATSPLKTSPVRSPQRPGYQPLNSPLHDSDNKLLIEANYRKKDGVLKKAIVKSEIKNPRGRPRKKETSAEIEAKKSKKLKKSENLNSLERKKRLNCANCTKLCDERRFFLQCGACEQRCHGKCVGLTEKRSRKLGEWFCEDCAENGGKGEVLYCVCKKPYDESQFYVGCDGCEDWFHPVCVGTTQQNVEGTNAGYLCPTCSNDGSILKRVRNVPSSGDKVTAEQIMASRKEFPLLWRLLDVLVNNQHSWPFRNPVDRDKLPRYYEVVQNPMGKCLSLIKQFCEELDTMRRKLENNEYQNLKSFVADACLIFDNTRQFYVKQNEIYQCADLLEKVFRSEIMKVSRDVDGHRSRVPSVLDIDTDQLLGFGSDCNMDPSQFLQDLL